MNSTVDVPATNADDLDVVSDVAAEEPLTEVTRLKNAMDNQDIDPNVCCMCFQLWQDVAL